jgi:hypothetical protein
MRQRSVKMSERMEDDYLPAKKAYLTKHKTCLVRVRGICRKWSKDVHHKAGRTGEALMDESTWLAVCRQCHDHLEANRAWAKAHGFLITRTVRR